MKSAFVFTSSPKRDADYRKALRRVGCRGENIIAIRNPDDISTDRDIRFAVIEIFNPEKADILECMEGIEEDAAGIKECKHVIGDDTPGIRVLGAIRALFPQCAIFAVSHTTCLNGSEYVDAKCLADRCVPLDWHKNAKKMVPLIKSQLEQAQIAHAKLPSMGVRREALAG